MIKVLDKRAQKIKLLYFFILLSSILIQVQIVEQLTSGLELLLGGYVLFLMRNEINRPIIMAFLLINLVLFVYCAIGEDFYNSEFGGMITRKLILLNNIRITIYFTVFYYITKRGALSDKEILIIFMFFFVKFLYDYTQNALVVSAERAKEVASGEYTNNIGYGFASILPLTLLLKKTILKYSFFFACIFLVVFSAKRGAMLVSFVFACYFFYNHLFKGKGRLGLKHILASTIIIGVVVYIVNLVISSNEYIYIKLFATFEDHYSSGRDEISSAIVNHMFDGSFFNLLFGDGFGTSVKVAGNFAHNDWLEVFSMAGIFGLLIYANLYFKIYQFIKINYNDVYKQLFLSSCIICFVRSFFSMSFFVVDSTVVPMFLLMGYGYGNLLLKGKNISNCRYQIRQSAC